MQITLKEIKTFIENRHNEKIKEIKINYIDNQTFIYFLSTNNICYNLELKENNKIKYCETNNILNNYYLNQEI